jgi:hypothetical protein
MIMINPMCGALIPCKNIGLRVLLKVLMILKCDLNVRERNRELISLKE